MTTKVTVDAHAGWPVKVEAVDHWPGEEASRTTIVGIVPPLEVREFYVTSSRQLIITEMERPSANQGATE
jgi:hypothetical protein